MDLTQLEPGDRVYAATSIFNDGSVPDRDPGALLAAEGTRGLLVRVGHLEEEPGRAVYLVRFEGEGLALGQPVGCWAEDLRADV
jgi:nitrogen fixation protein NifZ